MYFLYFFFFFFSSRRRHTRYWRDWSSDVCSSDLLPRVRGRRRVLGARRHGAHALPDRRGRRTGGRAREAPLDAQRTDPGRRRAPVRRAATWTAARSRRHRWGRTPGALHSMATLLRAARGLESGAARLRGPAVGRCEPARLHRVPLRVVAQQAVVRDHARAPRAAREARDVGRPPAQLLVALSRAAARARDGGAPGRARSRTARRNEDANSRPRGGCAALRRRDGADAARPRVAGAGRRLLPRRRQGGDARGAGDVARPDRGAPRRAERRRAAAAPGRGGARKDVHTAGARGARPGRRDGAGAAARLARSEGGAVTAGGPALAGARPVRLPPGPRAP